MEKCLGIKNLSNLICVMFFGLILFQFDESPTNIEYTPDTPVEDVMSIRITFEIDNPAIDEIEVFRLYAIVCVKESK